MHVYTCIYMLMRDAEGKKKEASKAMYTNNKAKQSNTTHPRQSFFHRALYQLSYRGATEAAQLAGAKSYISYIVHLMNRLTIMYV